VRIHGRCGLTGSCVLDVPMFVASGRSSRQKRYAFYPDTFASGELCAHLAHLLDKPMQHDFGSGDDCAETIKDVDDRLLALKWRPRGSMCLSGSTGMHTMHTHDNQPMLLLPGEPTRGSLAFTFLSSSLYRLRLRRPTSRRVRLRQVAPILPNSPEATPHAIPAAEHPKLAVAVADPGHSEKYLP
jgi:hypothetical protein